MFHRTVPLRPRLVLAWLATLTATAPAVAGMPTTAYVDDAGTCDYPTLQAAVDDLAPGSEIRIVGEDFSLPATLSIFDRRLRIVGGYPTCGAPAATGRTTIKPDFAGAPVISATGVGPGLLRLDLADLALAGGTNPGAGGGLRVTGDGQVNLFGVDLFGNSADEGGGIYVRALGAESLSVNLLAGSRIGLEGDAGNLAERGGGVYCENARMRLGHVAIASNTATEEGGGLYASNCTIVTTEEAGDLRIEDNEARNGGGIYAEDQSRLQLRSRPQQKISISHNRAILGNAPRRGGGVFLHGAGTRLEGSGLRIDGNVARSFAAGIMVSAAEAVLDRGIDSCPVGDDACSSLSGNEVRNDEGAITGSAAAAFVAGGGLPGLTLAETRVTGNVASNTVLSVGDAGTLVLTSVLVAGNLSGGPLLSVTTDGVLRGDFLTLADNEFATAAFRNNSAAPVGLELSRSILLVGPGNTHVDGPGSSHFECLNTGPGGALDGTDHAPGFEHAAAGDYRLGAGSGNLDRCTVDGAESPVDLAGRPRAVDRPEVDDGEGFADRGAYEDFDRAFADGFER